MLSAARLLSVLMLDVDHFKEVNDLHGHQAGDAVLRDLGALLKQSIRSVDLPARYGGEEMVVLLPNTEESSAAILADRLRRLVEEHPFVARADQPLRCTVSIGIAGYADKAEEAAGFVGRADAALYEAKRAGRNRVAVGKADDPG